MGEVKRIDDLDIDQNLKFQEKQWVAQRWAWWVMFLLMLAALAGLLGHGPLSARSKDTATFQLQYDHFLRLRGPAELSLTLKTDLAKPVVVVSRDYLQHFEIDQIYPEPESVSTSGDQTLVTFAPLSRDTEIQLDLIPQQVGTVQGRLGLQDTPDQVELSHLVYP